MPKQLPFSKEEYHRLLDSVPAQTGMMQQGQVQPPNDPKVRWASIKAKLKGQSS